MVGGKGAPSKQRVKSASRLGAGGPGDSNQEPGAGELVRSGKGFGGPLGAHAGDIYWLANWAAGSTGLVHSGVKRLLYPLRLTRN
ncbi:hypothetical protein NDU88_006812 [Pleurodeles waltl]|uniref:Uncharacterized protein n=1 Tax=Pleurodeles waltl TaxID=8319 RepID=A0AAV7RT39_PLEWA|nr:hypothetical protein NDU88_006812 [Pleurodeles waltl]